MAELSGKWLLNETLNGYINATVNFTFETQSGIMQGTGIYFDGSVMNFKTSDNTYLAYHTKWQYGFSKEITIDEGQENSSLLSWLNSNATKVVEENGEDNTEEDNTHEGDTPTPKTYQEQYNDLLNELADVVNDKADAQGKKTLSEIVTTARGILKPSGNLDITENGDYNVKDKETVNVNIQSESAMKKYLDAKKDMITMLWFPTETDASELFNYNDTENVTTFEDAGITRDGSVTNINYVTKLPLLNTKNVKNFDYAFFTSRYITEVPAYDARNATSMTGIFGSYGRIQSILMFGMKVKFSISSITTMEKEALVLLCSNCQVVTSTITLTMGSKNLAKLDGVYVKYTGVELYEGITCTPCVICDSTDTGAMLVTDYMRAKGWTLA